MKKLLDRYEDRILNDEEFADKFCYRCTAYCGGIIHPSDRECAYYNSWLNFEGAVYSGFELMRNACPNWEGE